MKDKDKEAFDYFWNYKCGVSNEACGKDDIQIVWEAACEYKQKELQKAIDALTLAVESASFFNKFADCNRDSWACRCEFCRDTKQTKSLSMARQALKELK
jgi:hypothetical protein